MSKNCSKRWQGKAQNYLESAFGFWGKVITSKFHVLVLVSFLSGFIYGTYRFISAEKPEYSYRVWMSQVSTQPL